MSLPATVTTFPLLHLPVELIVEIAVWGQYIWINDMFSPSSGAPHRRLAVGLGETVIRDEDCCTHVGHAVLPSCITESFAQSVLLPAHCLRRTCTRVREALSVAEVRLGTADNAMLNFKADDAGAARRYSRDGVSYESRTLIASPSCTCLLRGIRNFYDTLHDVKLSLPWATRSQPHNEDLFMRNHSANSPLQRFDLEYYEPSRSTTVPMFSIRAVRSLSATVSRTVNAAFFYTSPSLTALCICHVMSQSPTLGLSFWRGLALCAASLEYLTLDIPSAACVGGENFIHLPHLRYLRLVAPAADASWLLQALQLPPDLDIHLEPVYDWRAAAERVVSVMVDSGHVRPMEIPFAAMEEAADVGANVHPHGYWRFMTALTAPDQTSSIFHQPPLLHVLDENLNHAAQVAGLDIRLDPSTSPAERACIRFPEIVALYLADTLDEFLDGCADVEPDWRKSEPPGMKQKARRSLVFRDSLFSTAARENVFQPRFVKPVYDAAAYLMQLATRGKSGTAFAGFEYVNTLALHPLSWKPAYSLGWAHILEHCDGLEAIAICYERFWDDNEPFDETMEGILAPAHLEALATYLNDLRSSSGYPCRRLRRIYIRSRGDAPVHLGAAAFTERWERRFNTKRRSRSPGALYISVFI
ncbi:unnamed protein product [Peniophora sp. CBMAI 1063]|nr:unnamed protein product [Peniophora sp. CBMAI 1063]